MSGGKKKTELCLAGRGLKSLPDEIAQKAGGSITKLDLSDNQIEDGSCLAGFTVLEQLVLDRNGLKALNNFKVMPSVQTLWLNNNKISDLETLCTTISRAFPNLTYLSMMMNPACPNMYQDGGANQRDSYSRFRFFVIHKLPKLRFLDATEVSKEERTQSASKGKFAKVAKPQGASDMDESTPLVDQRKRMGDTNKPVKSQSYLAKSKPRYDGANSEGNRFIMNNDL